MQQNNNIFKKNPTSITLFSTWNDFGEMTTNQKKMT